MMRKLKDIGLKKIVLQLLAATLIFVSIGFASKGQNEKIFGEIVINISNQFNNYFIEENDILEIVTTDQASLKNGMLRMFDLRKVEKSLEEEEFIRSAQIFKDIKGNLVVNVVQQRPVARIVRSEGSDAYVSEDGSILPVSEKFTSRIILLSGAFTETLVRSQNIAIDTTNLKYFELIKFINSDPFWKAQIAQLNIEGNGEITIYPQVTKQSVAFGLPEDIDKKFEKLTLFYKKILPLKGWNSYSRVSLKYKDQIVCE